MKPMYRVEVQSHPVRGKAFSKRYSKESCCDLYPTSQ